MVPEKRAKAEAAAGKGVARIDATRRSALYAATDGSLVARMSASSGARKAATASAMKAAAEVL